VVKLVDSLVGSGRHILLAGPTAAGKTGLAIQLAREAEGCFELISADSMAIYKGMDIGTDKPTSEQLGGVKIHMVDLVTPYEGYSLFDFQTGARRVLADLEARGLRAIVVGGTGLYIRALVDQLDLPGSYPVIRAELEQEAGVPGGLARLFQELQGLDPLAASRMEPSNRRRIVRALEVVRGSGRLFSSYGAGLAAYPNSSQFVMVGLDRPDLKERIDERVDAQLAQGWLEEVRHLQGQGEMSATAAQAAGYRELGLYLDGAMTLAEAVLMTKARVRRLASRQRRWFRRDPRLNWIDSRRLADSS
jgi:tRNA dimethylallyltransferase